MSKILIIDGDDYLTRFYESLLTLQGFKVFVAHKGNDGLAQALKINPDLIMMNAIMPDATGFQMCNLFQRTPETKAIPLIMMSSLAHYPNQQKFAVERGATEHINRPTTAGELINLINRYVQRREEPKESTNKSTYNLSTNVHMALSKWLDHALTNKK